MLITNIFRQLAGGVAVVRSIGRSWPRVGVHFRCVVASVVAVHVSLGAGPIARNLADLSIEELMNESVTSVSKREQKLGDVASAITVLTNDDLQRSGASSLADALRLVPGLAVGSLNASQRAVSARGFNSTLANKQLVLVDGRAVYTPLFAGVFWDLQRPMLEDVDRVEIIRGPGATVWGANAVNGVISVMTRSARDTQGGLAFGGGGDVLRATGGFRYGGQVANNTYYRVFAGHDEVSHYDLPDGRSADDGIRTNQGGFRFDHHSSHGSQLTWQADGVAAEFDGGRSKAFNVNTLGRWTQELGPRSALEAQVYFDRTHRDEFQRSWNTINTADFAFQETLGLGESHDVIWGAGYRHVDGEVAPAGPIVFVRDREFKFEVFSAFVQDEVKLVPDRLTLTLGTKFEHNDVTGWEIQPSVRAVFKPRANQTLWSAVSRAVRTPDALESRDLYAIVLGPPVPGPGGVYLPLLLGNTNVRAEVLWAYEAGYRAQVSRQLSFELAAFYNRYREMIGIAEVPVFVPGTPIGSAFKSWDNASTAQTHGAELSINVAATRSWRLSGSYSALFAKISGVNAVTNIGWTAPKHQYSLRSSHDFGRRASLDLQFRAVSAIAGVPAYRTADVRFAWRFNEKTELSLVGQNLLDARHPEQPMDPAGMITSEVPRGFHAKLTWRF